MTYYGSLSLQLSRYSSYVSIGSRCSRHGLIKFALKLEYEPAFSRVILVNHPYWECRNFVIIMSCLSDILMLGISGLCGPCTSMVCYCEGYWEKTSGEKWYARIVVFFLLSELFGCFLASHIVFSVWDVFRPGALFESGCAAKSWCFLDFS